MFPSFVRRAAICGWVGINVPAIAAAQTVHGFPLQITTPVAYTDSSRFGRLIDGAVAQDGTVCVVDMGNTNIACHHIGQTGWTRFGRSGDGPGEFRAPYRIAFTPSGKIWVWDFQTQDASLFDSHGRFLGRAGFPDRYHQVDNILALGEDQLVFCGVTGVASVTRDSAIHIYRWIASGVPLQLVRAFAPLPPTEVREKAEHWGAGAVTWSSRHTLYYSERVPYRIAEYTTSGKLLRVMDGPVKLTANADSAIMITETSRSETIAPTKTATIVYPLRAIDVGANWILSGRHAVPPEGPPTLFWDLLDRTTGRPVASTVVSGPFAEVSLFGIDPGRLIAWGIGATEKDEAVWSAVLTIEKH